jgi:hypothetical protein
LTPPVLGWVARAIETRRMKRIQLALLMAFGCGDGELVQHTSTDAPQIVPDAMTSNPVDAASSSPDGSSPDLGPPFPRIGLLGIGGGQAYPQPDWEFYGRFDVVIIGANYESWSNSGRDRELIVQGIKNAVHPQGAAPSIPTRVINYIMFQETGSDWAQSRPILYNAINDNHWWLYQHGTSGTIAQTGDGDTASAVDIGADDTTGVAFAQAAASGPGAGLRPSEWFAHYFYNVYMSKARVYGTNAGLGAPSLDGFFADNMFCEARAGGDWNRDGVDDGSGIHVPPERWIQQGQANFFSKLQSLAPGKLSFGNYGNEYGNPQATPGPMNQVFQGGIFESLIGKSWSLDTYQRYDQVLAAFNKAFDVSRAPQMLCMGGTIPNGGSALSGGLPFVGTHDNPSTAVSGEYQWARYNLGTCLLTDGYCIINSQLDRTGSSNVYDGAVASQRYYDEYGGNYPPLAGNTVPPLPTSPNAPPRGYLGYPIAGPLGVRQTTARWNKGSGLGVFAREFDHGIVILNPKGNGVVTLTTSDLPGAWHRLAGTQAPAINDGSRFTGVTLQDRDAIILLR